MTTPAQEEIHAHTKFGLCRACGVWFPRDKMLGMNLRAFPSDAEERRIAIRLCPECFDEAVGGLSRLQWDNRLLTLSELKSVSAKVAL